MGGGGTKYKFEIGSQIQSPAWLVRAGDGPELTHMSLESFELQTVIGKGKFGIVYYAEHKQTARYVAIKFISKKILYETKGRERTQQEINILRTMNHPFVISYLGGFECIGAISLVFEYAPGGELYTRMKRNGTFTETVAKFYFCELACALGYLHNLSIVYRDLKPENVLIHVNGHIKLCDFGFATVVGTTDAPLHDGCGTAMYVAPEIAGGHMKLAHGLPVDWWSLGCILYEMIVGEAPFGDTDKMSKFEIFNNINGAQVSFPLSVGGPLKSIIRGLLEKNQQLRFNFSAVKVNPWVNEIDWEQVNNGQIKPPWIPSDCQIPNKSNFVDWPGESYPTGCTSQENHYCSNFDLAGHTRQRRESGGAGKAPKSFDVEKNPTEVRKIKNSEVKSSLTLESWKSDSSAPAPRLSETKSRSSSRLDANHPGNKSRSHSRLESGLSSSTLNRSERRLDIAVKSALSSDDEIDEPPQKHLKHGKIHHVPVY